MKRVLQHIAELRTAFAAHRFLVRLRGPGTVEQARVVAPRVAFFVLGFQDVLRLAYQRCSDPHIKAIAKTHRNEDSGHDDWYLHDLEQFGVQIDVRWLFSAEHEIARDVAYAQIATVLGAADDICRLATILALEATGAECFETMIGFLERAGHVARLRYFARSHQRVEAEHEMLVATDEVGGLSSLRVDDETLPRARATAETIFASMSRLLDDLEAALAQAAAAAPETEASMVALAKAVATSWDSDELRRASRDFGGIVDGRATAVVRPKSAEEVARVVTLAAQHGFRLTPRACGLSQSGQSVPRRGVSVCLEALDELGPVDADARSLWCGPAVTWRQVLHRSAQDGLCPEVMPLNLDLSLGGSLSAGCLGTTSHRLGFAASNVRTVEVVTGTGQRVRCGPLRERAIYDTVLGGVGRAGIITAVELALRPLRPRTRTLFLRYSELGDVLRDMLSLSGRDRVTHLEGFCAASVQGLRKGPHGRRPFAEWSYGLHVTCEHDGEPSDDDEVLAGLQFSRMLGAEDDDTVAYAARYDIRFEVMRGIGAWNQPHPWFEVFLPLEGADRVVSQALEILPLSIGDGHRLTLIAGRGRPMAIALPSEGQVLCFAVLPAGVPPAFREPTLEALRRVHELCIEAGGKRYLSGWLPAMDDAAWRRHYGADYPALLDNQRKLDPQGVFEASLPRLGPPR